MLAEETERATLLNDIATRCPDMHPSFMREVGKLRTELLRLVHDELVRQEREAE